MEDTPRRDDDGREQPRNDWQRYPPRIARKQSASYKVRRAVLKSARSCYMGCGRPPTQVDHVTPLCFGGADDQSNMAAICADCHKSKSSREANHMRWHVHKIGRRKGVGNVAER